MPNHRYLCLRCKQPLTPTGIQSDVRSGAITGKLHALLHCENKDCRRWGVVVTGGLREDVQEEPRKV